MLIEKIGQAAMLEQTAEECAELAKACLKMARHIRNENPTFKSSFEIKENLHEEIADVLLCLKELHDGDILNDDDIEKWGNLKVDRIKERFGS